MTKKKASSTTRNVKIGESIAATISTAVRDAARDKEKLKTAPAVHTKKDMLAAFRIGEKEYQILRYVVDRPRLWERKGFSYDVVEYLVSRHMLRLRNYSRTAIIGLRGHNC